MKSFTVRSLTLLFSLSLIGQASAGIPAGYRLETVTLPRGAVTVLGLCHKPNGTLAIVSWEGEVWEYKDNLWTLFAENLMDPNGIYYDEKEDAYYVAQTPELTRLVDTNQDGICDRYECITNAFGASGQYHEYHYGPVVDSLGRKYASLNLASNGGFSVTDGRKIGGMNYNAPWRGWVYRSDRLGHFQPLACGFRSPCGIGMSPQDELFITDNQGDWVGANCLYHIREGNFYGQPTSLPARPDFTKEKVLSMTAKDFEKIRTVPAVCFPYGIISRSPGSPVWDTTGGKFGPFQNQIFVGDQSVSNLFRCGLEEIDGDYQGFCVNFLDKTESGTVKMNFDAQGRLWTAQVGRGWLSRGGKRTALQYAAWDGKTTPFEIHHVNLTRTGFKVTFTQPIGSNITPTVNSWHYRYHSIYGSDQFDEKKLPVSNYALSKDRKTVTFDVPLTPGKVYALTFGGQKNTEDSVIGNHTAYYTLNKLIPAGEPAQRRVHNPERVVSGGLLGSWERHDERRPLPTVVAPLPPKETSLAVPANATVLDASQWTNPNWKFDENGVMPRSKGNNTTKQAYGSARIHLEFMVDPSDDSEWRGQLWGNSGIFPMSHYELQVMNSHENPTYADGQCGALYGQVPPQVNASRPPGQWQSYDILVKEPTFSDSGEVLEPVRITVYHNGILIHDDASFLARVNSLYQKHGKLPLLIQDHKGTGVSFRNLWIVPDIDYDKSLQAFRNNFASSPSVLSSIGSVAPPISIIDQARMARTDRSGDQVITEDEFDLFKGGLANWQLNKPGGWVMKDGVLSPAENGGGYIWTKDNYEDFEVVIEYKTSKDCNSGLFFRADPKNHVQGGFEIQIASAGIYDGKQVGGSIYGALAPTERAGKPDGEWNTMKLTCIGPKITVVLNGKTIAEANIDKWTTANLNPDGTKNSVKTPLKDLPRTGRIGFQYHGHPVWFRNVKLKQL
jgi:hypothetical protein